MREWFQIYLLAEMSTSNEVIIVEFQKEAETVTQSLHPSALDIYVWSDLEGAPV